MIDRVQYGSGMIPRWFTYLFHLWSKRRCKQEGHSLAQWRTVCDHCGEILETRLES